MNEAVPPAITPARAVCERILAALATAVLGKPETLRYLLAAYITGGHVLLEDYPGTGKTTLAKAFAALLGKTFTRIQCTPDLLPADILGVSIFNPRLNDFELHRGPIFTEILLADEINRASPRTQSALLEAMAERQVTLDVATHPLSFDFFVVATQNPVESQGTYPLPEAQLDRFSLRLSLGYLPLAAEVDLVMQQPAMAMQALKACVTPAELDLLPQALAAIPCARDLIEYAVRLVAETRLLDTLALGASPRASITLVQCARALALFDGAPFVTPEHLQALAVPVLAHRLILKPNGRYEGLNDRAIVQALLASVPVPR